MQPQCIPKQLTDYAPTRTKSIGRSMFTLERSTNIVEKWNGMKGVSHYVDGDSDDDDDDDDDI
jgi:hypothetical protein